MITVGSLCTGYDGLGLAVQALFPDAVTGWVCDPDPHVARWLGQRWPTVANLGDLTQLDDLPPVDVVTAGFPCQPISSAGLRKGINDERWIWPDIARLVSRMDPPPRLLLLENVPRLLTIDGGAAMGQVVHGLAQAGFVGRWRLLRASDVGAAHRRERWFCVATPADSERGGWDWRKAAQARNDHTDRQEGGRVEGAGVTTGRPHPAPHPDSDPQREEPIRLPGCGDTAELGHASPERVLPTPRTSDANGGGPHGDGGLDLRTAVRLLPTPTAGDAHGTRQSTAPNPRSPHHTLSDVRWLGSWGDYAAAIADHEQAIARRPPTPVDDRNRLEPAFVEWLMMLPAGWVTDPNFDLPRTAQLRMLGNGVVSAQATAAYASLLDRQAVAA